MFPVEIKVLSALRVAGVIHRGAYNRLGSSFEMLSGLVANQSLEKYSEGLIAVCYDDPGVVAESELRAIAGIVVKEDTPANLLEEDTILPGGDYAVMRVSGSYANLPRAYEELLGVWLRQSGREKRKDAPSFERYLNTPMDTKVEDLQTDIYLPLECSVVRSM
uniref:AraC effector-binding domain-containing protein n=1 Tax=Compsopogon caeruleus TaxID=31354 RepID=A0A7S1TI93_9RHOD